ncbi:MAG TPA: RNA polymerase sigma factor [Pirellulales bacterium]|jgi:RNA polymerase sigma factor (sigma-70 family)|nr:RNA polymerase sigma factor [Pirellulales bacterium]
MPHDRTGTKAAGTRQWVMALVAEYEQRLTRYAQRLTGDLHSARDVVQHAFLRLCDESPTTIERPGAWLYTVCHRRAIDVRRQAIRVLPLDTGDATSNGHASQPVYSRERDPRDAAELKDAGRALQRAVDLLPEAQRQVVNLWAEGFDYRDISQITGRGEAYIRVLMHRALTELRRHPIAQQLISDTALRNPTPRSPTPSP